ncbi:hypothetical protein EPD60_16665 [Flaviaesturariibacter flavus]|uniref:Restriction endonuclease n=1 Tax=Flaviaesturariibacter flavus TaxID=2502780 RepID=A0A4V2NV56_9BACT|nr:hypothetical protein [Flaviaesturariibacter flavus]TCJ12176.1 hypothetical protein EPD60_16665 [Flaviaesturariibacter flavus]
MTAVQLLGFREFFPADAPGTKQAYANQIGKDEIQKLCCLMLTYCKIGNTPPNHVLIAQWFQYMGKSYTDSVAYHTIIDAYRSLIRRSRHENFFLLSEEALLNMYVWATENQEIPESLNHQDGSFMVRLFMLLLLFNDDVLANYEKALHSAQKYQDRVLMRLFLAQRFPQNDIVEIDYGKLVYTQLYKLMELLNFLEGTPAYQALFSHMLADFQCSDKQEFFKALGGAVIIPLNPRKTGINYLVLDEQKDPEKSSRFLNKLVFDPGDVTLGPNDYKTLRDRPLQRDGNEYRVVFDYFLVKKLYNGIIFKLSDYVNRNSTLMRGPFFGAIRNDFSEGVLLYNTMGEILEQQPGVKFTGNEFKDSGLQREPDYYYHYDNRVLLMESKDFFMPAADKLSYDFDQIVAGLQADGRLGKAVLQSATNALRVLKEELILDGGYAHQALLVYPIIVVHDSLYNTPTLNYWVNEWFQV